MTVRLDAFSGFQYYCTEMLYGFSSSHIKADQMKAEQANIGCVHVFFIFSKYGGLQKYSHSLNSDILSHLAAGKSDKIQIKYTEGCDCTLQSGRSIPIFAKQKLRLFG